MAIKRKASGPAAGQSPTKRATKIQPPQIFDAPPGDKIVVPRTTTPRGKTYNARKRRTVVPDLEPASPMSRESDDELDILPRTRSGKIPPTPSPSPSKRSRAAKPSPTKPPPLKSPAKRRPPKARTPSPSPIPDSEVESREPSPPIASSSRRASSTMDPIIPPAEEPIPIPPLDISISHAASSELPFCLNAQKREILRAIPNPRTLSMKKKSPPIASRSNSSLICSRERWFEEKEIAACCLVLEAVARPGS
ncbi:hypothetical protein B0H13DRAFT_424995 [Mycena leptocephala]|nr:hypothetical protein B0H13DRAFT_424995 [Mycena leptocephala]